MSEKEEKNEKVNDHLDMAVNHILEAITLDYPQAVTIVSLEEFRDLLRPYVEDRLAEALVKVMLIDIPPALIDVLKSRRAKGEKDAG